MKEKIPKENKSFFSSKHIWLGWKWKFYLTDKIFSSSEDHSFICGRNLLIIQLPWWFRQLRVSLQCKRPEFDPWVEKIPWRKKWQTTPVFLPGKCHGQRSLAGYSPWGHKELDMTEVTYHTWTHMERGLDPSSGGPRKSHWSELVEITGK